MLGCAKGSIEYLIGDKKIIKTWKGFDFPELEGLKITGKIQGYTSMLTLTPSDTDNPPIINHLDWEIPFTFTPKDRIFLNGYQSWTDSRERFPNEAFRSVPPLGRLLNPIFKFAISGDYDFLKTSPRKGDFHGFTYGYVRPAGSDRIIFLGSLSEKEGFTIIRTSVIDSCIRISWDCGGLVLNRSRQVLELFTDQGEEEEVFNTWFKAMDIEPPEARPSIGWTSWYNYYQNINEEIILKNLEGFGDRNLTIDTFQIDDGFQTRVGDWLSIDHDKFPRELSPLVKQIHGAGLKAGLWLAPFGAEKRSELVKNHPDWILKNRNGKRVWGGGNWGGFYALDIYNKGFRSYLKEVFSTILDRWHFDMVKLDFLYAACLAPPPDKTRGEVMADGMKLLRELVGSKSILGCGVPLGSAFGMVEYCRIGCDISLDWDNRMAKPYDSREGVSTRNGLGNALGRRHLDGRAFLNDPDVFLLREDNIKMTAREKNTLFQVNSLTGSLIFTSDEVAVYDDDKISAFNALSTSREILHLKQEGDIYKLKFLEGRKEKLMVVNLSDEEYRDGDILLAPRETKVI
ncbi:MAG: alpha-galactosidase [Spirochaetales bacterium]|nr:alpha-galactosidase [Spirochaetales bacterium]